MAKAYTRYFRQLWHLTVLLGRSNQKVSAWPGQAGYVACGAIPRGKISEQYGAEHMIKPFSMREETEPFKEPQNQRPAASSMSRRAIWEGEAVATLAKATKASILFDGFDLYQLCMLRNVTWLRSILLVPWPPQMFFPLAVALQQNCNDRHSTRAFSTCNLNEWWNDLQSWRPIWRQPSSFHFV